MKHCTLEIVAKPIDEIKKRIERVENSLMELKYRDGLSMTFSGEKNSLSNRMQSYNVPGVSISVINNYEVEWAKSWGVKDVRTESFTATDTLFEAGSTSKALTAAAVAS